MPAELHNPVADPSAEKSVREKNRLRTIGDAVVLLVAAALRLYALSLKPLHHDEGVNGLFLLRLFREGFYKYDAANYHGPTLYYCALITSSVNNMLFGGEGTTTDAIRFVPVFFGIGIVALVIAMRKRLGEVGTLVAAALLAVSPGMVFFSRDFIHEIPLVFFTLWWVFGLLRFYDTREAKELFISTIALALMFATKETAGFSVAAIAASAVLASVLSGRRESLSVARFGGSRRVVLLAIGSVAVFAACIVVFYSSFFGNLREGLHDAIAAYGFWFKTGTSQHKAPWFTYVRWMMKEEPVILVSGVCGLLVALRTRNRFALFTGLWGFAILFGYSILPYKTPWIQMNAVVPMSMCAGFAAQEMWNAMSSVRSRRFAAIGIIAAGLLISFVQSVRLNFYHYDDDRYVYPYAQTFRGFLDMVAEVERISERKGTGNETAILVMSPDYWPLPWYLRNQKRIGYSGTVMRTDSTIVIASTKQIEEFTPMLGNQYREVGKYPLRPGVQLVLYEANNSAK